MTLPNSSRAAVLVEYEKPLEIRELPVPELESGAMLVKTDAATLCGTDYHMRHGDLSFFSKTPVLLGHEYTGTVVANNGRERDANDQAVREGDRIVWAYPWCGKCYFCTIARQPTACPYTQMYGWGPCDIPPYLTGGLSEYMYVRPACHVLKVPEGLDPHVVASTTCAFRTVIHAFERLELIGSIRSHETVVIFGCGPVGLFALAAAVVHGAGQIVVLGAPAGRLEVAKRWGADVTLDIQTTTAEERKEVVRGLTQGRGADLAIDCAGPAAAFTEAVDIVRRAGRVLEIGASDPKPASISHTNFNAKMVAVIGSLSGTIAHYRGALQFIKRHGDRFDFRSMITNIYPLDKVNEALDAMERLEEIKPSVQVDA